MVANRIGQISLGRFILLWALSATLILIAISFVLGRGAVDKRIWQDAEVLAKAEITRLSLIAERVIVQDRALLNEMLSQSASDPRIEQILVAGPDGRVLCSTRVGYKGRLIREVPDLDPSLLDQLATKGPLYSVSDKQESRLYYAQSFAWPPPPGKIRSDQLGFVVVSINLANTEFETRAAIMGDQLLVAGIFLCALLLLLAGFFYLTHKPLKDLTLAADRYRTGDFSHQVSVSGIREMKDLAESFSIMSQEIERMLSRLQQSESKFRSLLEHSPEGILAFDASGRLAYMNAAFSTITGIEPGRLEGLPLAEFDELMRGLCRNPGQYLPLSDQTGGSEDAGETIELQNPEMRIMKRSVIELDLPQLKRIVYFQDITILSLVDRMKSEFISTAAHELRTPMSMVLGYAELLLTHHYDEHDRAEMIQAIHSQAKSIVYLLNELLDLARIEAGADKAFNFGRHAIGPLLESLAASFIQHDDPRRVKLAPLPELPPLQIDPEKIGQALKNCLSNAYKFSSPGSEVSLSAASVTGEHGEEVAIRISDHGIGMTAEQMARMFDRFYRADTSGKIPGTGLGMSLVKEIVERHRGRVEVASQPGAGTEITIYLPPA